MHSHLQNEKVIVHVVQHLAPGGLECLVLDFLRFSEPNHRVLVVSLEGTKNEALAHWPKLTQYQDQLLFLNKPAGRSLTTLWKLFRLFSAIKPHVVHTHHIGPLLYAGITARCSATPVRIHTEHDVWHLSNRIHRYLQYVALRWIQPHLVGDAHQVTQVLARYFHYPRTRTIKNGIDCARFTPGNQTRARQQFNLPEGVPLIGCAGRLEWVKGQDQLLHALSHLPCHIHLAVAGKGSQLDSLSALCRELGLTERVHFLGLVDNMPEFYRALDIFCLPSRSEGFPLSPLEAQACGIPVVLTDVGSAKETLCPHTGSAVESDDPLQMASSLLHALQHKTEISPRHFVQEHGDIHQMVKAYNALSEGELA
ncbi:glycosyltransferase [Vibrio mimicus]